MQQQSNSFETVKAGEVRVGDTLRVGRGVTVRVLRVSPCGEGAVRFTTSGADQRMTRQVDVRVRRGH